jgi:hypothetical protein
MFQREGHCSLAVLRDEVGVSETHKKCATQAALDSLNPVDVASLSEGESRCPICMVGYHGKPVRPRSPYVEEVDDEDLDDRQTEVVQPLLNWLTSC